MSNIFPLESDAFSGGARLTAGQRSEGNASDLAPLYEALNAAAQSAEASGAMTGAVDLSAATDAVIAAANREVTTNAGAARTYTLPAYATAPDGWEHTFISLDAATNDMVIAAAGTDTINGVAGDITLTTTNYEWVKVMKLSGASGWTAIGGTTVTPA